MSAPPASAASARDSAIQRRRTSRIIAAGFGVLLLLFVILLAGTLNELREMGGRVDAVASQGLAKVTLVQEMRTTARKRSMTLAALVAESDLFARDELLTQYRSLGARFVQARQQFVAGGLSREEQAIIERQGRAVMQVQADQAEVIDLVYAGREQEALGLLVRAALPKQEAMIDILFELTTYAEALARGEVAGARLAYQRTQMVVWAGGVAVALGTLFIAYWVRRRFFRLMDDVGELSAVLKENLRELTYQKMAMDEHAIVSIADAAGNITYVNDKFMQISGYGRDELMGRNHRLLKSGTQPQALFEDMWSTISAGRAWHGEVCNRAKSGRLYWVKTTIVPFLDENGLPYQYISVRTEITEAKQNEAALRRAKQELEQRVAERTAELRDQLHFTTELMEALPNPIFCKDVKGHYLGVNRAWEELFGVRREQIVGKTLDTLYPSAPEVAAKHAAMDQALWQNPGKQMYEIAIPAANGEIRSVVFYKATFTSAQGRIGGLVGGIVDITDRKRMEQQLTAAKQELEADIAARIEAERALSQFKLTLDQTHDCVFMFNPETLKFCYANRGAMEQVGYAYEELMGMTPLDIKPDFDEAKLQALLRPLMDGSRPVVTFETIHRHKDGHLIPVEIVLQYVHVEGAQRFVAIVRDVTERQRAEAELQARNRQLEEINEQLHEAKNQLLQSEKMASVGQLAAGVAHEINNPIGYVFSNLGSLGNYLKDMLAVIDTYEVAEAAISDADALARVRQAKDAADLDFVKEDVQSLMSECKEGITRVKKIVQDLKDFSHLDSSDEWQGADLHKGIDSTLNIVRNELKYKAKIVKEYGELPEVECLPSQLNQVFLNMLVNAGHAIEEQGTITLRSGIEEERVWVEIEDTGKGIAPEDLKRIFDPFFTTKPVGTGTGLGLSLSYSIVQKHHGHIEVSSEVGKGTRFRVWLPIHQQAEPAVEGQIHE